MELVALAAHGLHQNAKVQDATSIDHQRIGRVGVFHFQGEVLLGLLVKAFTQVARGDVFAFLAEERRVVDGEQHAHRGLVHVDGRQRLGVLVVGHGVANLEVVDAHQCDDVAGLHRLLGAFLAQALKGVKLLDGRFGHGAVAFYERDVLSGLQCAAFQSTHSDTTHVGTVI